MEALWPVIVVAMYFAWTKLPQPIRDWLFIVVIALAAIGMIYATFKYGAVPGPNYDGP